MWMVLFLFVKYNNQLNRCNNAFNISPQQNAFDELLVLRQDNPDKNQLNLKLPYLSFTTGIFLSLTSDAGKSKYSAIF